MARRDPIAGRPRGVEELCAWTSKSLSWPAAEDGCYEEAPVEHWDGGHHQYRNLPGVLLDVPHATVKTRMF